MRRWHRELRTGMRAVASKSNADVIAEYEAMLQNHTRGTLVSPLRFTEQTDGSFTSVVAVVVAVVVTALRIYI